MRLLLIFIVLASLVLISFFIWGDGLANIFTREGSINWLYQYGEWAWVAAIVLLLGDLVLPIPGTLVMSALGYIYGFTVGGLVGAAGSFLSGSLGYWLCRLVGERVAVRLLGQKDFERGKKLSGRIGGWIVALSRWLPVFPEVVACMAGLTRMSPGYFHAALVCGSLPLGFTYAYIGHTGIDHPWLAIALSAGLPPFIWFVISKIFRLQLHGEV
ncbi:MAG TPA: VTT domain-containing protein [Chryseolinea sp.]|nr:VTT domain-containing protein [Chryseolinea sp.]